MDVGCGSVMTRQLVWTLYACTCSLRMKRVVTCHHATRSSDLHCEKTMLGGGQNFAINGLCGMRYGIGADEVCRLYSVDDSAVLRDWDLDTGQCISSMPAHELGIKCVVARDGCVMTGSLDMTVKLWDATSFDCMATLDCVGDSVMALEIIAGSWLLAAGSLSSCPHLALGHHTPADAYFPFRHCR